MPVAEDLNLLHENSTWEKLVSTVQPKPKTYVPYKLGEDWFQAKVLSSQPKRAGVNKD